MLVPVLLLISPVCKTGTSHTNLQDGLITVRVTAFKWNLPLTSAKYIAKDAQNLLTVLYVPGCMHGTLEGWPEEAAEELSSASRTRWSLGGGAGLHAIWSGLG
jgi:hypothetical protein